jgi:hypothetical protein
VEFLLHARTPPALPVPPPDLAAVVDEATARTGE